MIPISSPHIDNKAKKYVNKCLDTNWISSQGEYVNKLEKSLAKYHNTKYCIVTSSCTAALHLAIKSLNLGKGDEIICPNLTFIAPANMIVLSGAKIQLVDVDPETFAIDHKQIEKKINKKTKAIMVVHQMGHSADMDPITKLVKKYISVKPKSHFSFVFINGDLPSPMECFISIFSKSILFIMI